MESVTSLFVCKMVAAAGPKVDGVQMLRSVGLDAGARLDTKVMIAASAYYDLLERLSSQIDVTELPLLVGATMRSDDYGALGLAFKAAPSLRGSYARVERYARLWSSVVEYELELAGDATWFHLHRSGPRGLGMRLSNEATLASATTIGRGVCANGAVVLREVHLRHKGPKQTAKHAAYFGCPVIFGSDRDAILFANTTLDQPNRLGDKGISHFLLGHLDQELADAAVATEFKDRIRDFLARSLSDGMRKMEDIARRLGLSARSLHRRLSAEGLSFQP